MHQATRARAVQVAETHRTVRWSGSRQSGLHGRRVRASLTPPTGAVSGAEAHRTGGMRRRRATRSTTCARRASRTRGTNRRLGNRRAVLRTPVTVTVRVTVSRGAERVAEEKCSHDESKAGWEKEVEALWCQRFGKVHEEMASNLHEEDKGYMWVCGPLSVWKHRGDGEGGAGREGGGEVFLSCTCHAVNLGLKGLKLQSESSD